MLLKRESIRVVVDWSLAGAELCQSAKLKFNHVFSLMDYSSSLVCACSAVIIYYILIKWIGGRSRFTVAPWLFASHTFEYTHTHTHTETLITAHIECTCVYSKSCAYPRPYRGCELNVIREIPFNTLTCLHLNEILSICEHACCFRMTSRGMESRLWAGVFSPILLRWALMCHKYCWTLSFCCTHKQCSLINVWIGDGVVLCCWK